MTEFLHAAGDRFDHDYANAADALEFLLRNRGFLLRNRGDHDAAYHDGDQ